MEQRRVIDYGLRRRAVLRAIADGEESPESVRDATTYLLSAANYHGEIVDQPCPLCAATPLRRVHWIFGDAVGPASGSARSLAELEVLAATTAEFTVHVVEVCTQCHWNYLVYTFATGRADLAPPRRSARARR